MNRRERSERAAAHRRELLAKFSPEQIQIYKEQFEGFDLNGDGVISASELENVSRTLGYRLSRREIRDIMRANDVDANGYLSFDEFLCAMPANEAISEHEHRMAEARRKFQEYDRNGDGVVTVQEAHDVLQKEFCFTPSQTQKLVSRYDRNHDGHLSYEEFVSFYKKVRSQADQIRQMFVEFDTDKNGSISTKEAKRMLHKLDMPDEEIETLVAIHDTNKDGELQYEEFVSFVLHS